MLVKVKSYGRTRLEGFCDKLYFDASSQWDLRDSESAPRMRALGLENFPEELGSSIGNQMLFGECGRTVDQHQELHNPRNPVEIARGGFEGGHQLDGNAARSFPSFGRREVLTQLANPGLPGFFRDVPGNEQEIAGAHKGQESR